MKVLPHVMRNINEFNIPAGNSHGYEVLYFGVNLILMLNYRLSFDVEVKNSNKEIQVLIFSRKDVLVGTRLILIVQIIYCSTSAANDSLMYFLLLSFALSV